MDRQADGMSAPDALTGSGAAVTTRLADDAPEAFMPSATDPEMAGESAATPDEPAGQEYLLFWLGEWPCLVRLAELREALPVVPGHAALPFSPRWLWGIFPLRTDLVALVDPMPVLMHGPDAARAMDVTRAPRAASANDFGPVEALRALVIGEGDHLLALLVDRIGEICAVTEGDRRPGDLADQPGEVPLAQYVAGAYTVAGVERDALELRIARLADDIFAALEERSAL